MMRINKMLKSCCLLVCALAALGVFSAATAPPAHAQIIKPQGIPIPSFFFSPAERRAREACAQELPNCRTAVRAQMEQEMAVSLALPWVMLGIAVLAVLFWLRGQERKKAQARLAARANHNPGAFRKLDRDRTERAKDDEDADELN
jgi:hypothetical protein